METKPNFSPRAMLIRALKDYDRSRERTQQVELGPSSLGDCERKVYHELIGTPKIQETEILPALLGTFIHAGIEKAIKSEDPFGDDFFIEIAAQLGAEFNNMPGHADLFMNSVACVVDWKTTTKKSMAYFPSRSNIWQAQNYGLMMEEQGRTVKWVCVVVVPRDGRMADIGEWIAPYDREIALEGQRWLAELRVRAENKDMPEPTKNAKDYCQFYCEYFDPTAEVGCPGLAGRRGSF